jgi:hypothetical protein
VRAREARYYEFLRDDLRPLITVAGSQGRRSPRLTEHEASLIQRHAAAGPRVPQSPEKRRDAQPTPQPPADPPKVAPTPIAKPVTPLTKPTPVVPVAAPTPVTTVPATTTPVNDANAPTRVRPAIAPAPVKPTSGKGPITQPPAPTAVKDTSVNEPPATEPDPVGTEIWKHGTWFAMIPSSPSSPPLARAMYCLKHRYGMLC